MEVGFVLLEGPRVTNAVLARGTEGGCAFEKKVCVSAGDGRVGCWASEFFTAR